MNKFSFAIIILAFIPGFSTFSQHYAVTTYTIENGLPTRMVQDATQDSLGNMWFATYSGIASYDGFAFLTYNHENGLPAQQYRHIKWDEKGTLWAIPVKLFDTVVFMQNQKWSKLGPVDRRFKSEITSFDMLYIGEDPALAFGSSKGMEIYCNDQWTHLDFISGADTNRILFITSVEETFYVTTNFGIYKVSKGGAGWKTEIYLTSGKTLFLAMQFENQGVPGDKLWIFSPDTLYCYQDAHLIYRVGGFNLQQPFIVNSASIGIDETGNVFFGNNWAKYFLNRETKLVSPLMVRNGFSSNGTTSIFLDREFNVWFCDTRGIDKLSDLNLLNYYEINGLLENEVTAIAELQDGRFVLGHNNGLSILDKGVFSRIPFSGATNNQARVLDIVQDGKGNVWFAASAFGLGKLMPNGTLKWFRSDKLSMVTSVQEDTSGRIWVASIRSLFYIEKGELIEYKFKQGIPHAFRKLFSSRSGNLLAASTKGFFHISMEKLLEIPSEEGLKEESFFSYWQSKKGFEYIGTNSGLCIIENNKIKKIDLGGFRVDSPVYFIFQDRKDVFWIGSNNGVLIWDGENIPEAFGYQNGLAGRETNRSAGLMDTQGRIWVGTEKGLSCFLPGFINPGNVIPEVRLLSIEDSKGIHHSFNGAPNIDYTSNTLYFSFRAASFVKENMLNYRYKLIGVDHDWQFTNQANLDKIKYMGLRPGKYHFMVQARNGNGKWSKLVQSGPIIIKTPLHRSWWFLTFLFTIVCLFIYGVIQILLQRKYSRKLENEIAERKESERKLHESRELYRLITEKMTDVVWLMNMNGKSLFVSKSIEQFSGFSVEEYLSQSIEERFTADSAFIAKNLLMREKVKLEESPELLKGYVYTQRMEYKCKDGKTKWGELLMTPYFGLGNQWLGIHGVTRDITERKLSEDALREKAEELERFNNLMIGRELKMVELKREINELIINGGGQAKYIIHE